MQKIIKICGITTPAHALEAAFAGADWIGLVFHPGSPRFVSLTQAREITEALSHTTARPVAIFTEQSSLEMKNICEECTIEIVQLHGARARAEHSFLPTPIQRIYALAASEYSSSKNEEASAFCDPDRD